MFASLRQRLVVLVLIPVALLLVVFGVVGFVYTRDLMLDQWREASLLKLERASHFIEMRLVRPLDRIRMIASSTGHEGPNALQDQIIEHLAELDGISQVRKLGPNEGSGPASEADQARRDVTAFMRFDRAKRVGVESTRPDAGAGNEAVSLEIDLRDRAGAAVGRLEIAMQLGYLLQDLQRLGCGGKATLLAWWTNPGSIWPIPGRWPA